MLILLDILSLPPSFLTNVLLKASNLHCGILICQTQNLPLVQVRKVKQEVRAQLQLRLLITAIQFLRMTDQMYIE